MVNHLLNGTTRDNRPAIFSFGVTSSKELCRDKCSSESLCYAYTWFVTGDDWDKMCYGRGFGAPEKVENADNLYCGVKTC